MRTKDEAKSYLEGLAKKAGLDENGIKALLANEDVLEDARNHLTRHDEMASGIDRARNEAAAKTTEMQDWYNKIGKPAWEEAQQIKTVNERYRQQFGDLEDVAGPSGNGAHRNANGQFASRQELEAFANTGAQVAKQLAFITADYNSRFGSKYGPMTYEQLEEWEKFAVSRGKPPIESYREWVRPKEQELQKADEERRTAEVEARIKAAREEGFKEGQTRKQWGSETTRTTDQFGRDLEAVKAAKESPDDADRAGDQAFLKAWDEWDSSHAAAH